MAAFEEEEAVARATLRVRADLIDRFVNEAGEIAIARSRVEGEMRNLRGSLLDLTENVIRLRSQLRDMEIQAESQMQSRIAKAEALEAAFDPLEMDRFTRLQELTRMMAESVNDVSTVQHNLLRNLDVSDAALSAQGRLSPRTAAGADERAHGAVHQHRRPPLPHRAANGQGTCSARQISIFAAARWKSTAACWRR